MIQNEDLLLLYKYAKECNFIIETGAGRSTHHLSKASIESGGRFFSIEAGKSVSKGIKSEKIDGCEHRFGWSVSYDDFIFPGNIDFVQADSKNYNKNGLDSRVVFSKEKKARKFMDQIGRADVIRKIIGENLLMKLDFFFCDSGEYCGLAEWNIVKREIKVGGYFAIHDIYYPKSIKGFKVKEKIENDENWKVVVVTDNKQGLLIAKRIQ